MEFSRFWEAKVVIFGNFGSPGALFGGSGYHFDDFWVCCDFGSVRERKSHPIWRQKPYHYPTFGSAGFWVFFEAYFISFFGFWEAGGSILDLISALFGRPRVPLNVSKT